MPLTLILNEARGTRPDSDEVLGHLRDRHHRFACCGENRRLKSQCRWLGRGLSRPTVTWLSSTGSKSSAAESETERRSWPLCPHLQSIHCSLSLSQQSWEPGQAGQVQKAPESPSSHAVAKPSEFRFGRNLGSHLVQLFAQAGLFPMLFRLPPCSPARRVCAHDRSSASCPWEAAGSSLTL